MQILLLNPIEWITIRDIGSNLLYRYFGLPNYPYFRRSSIFSKKSVIVEVFRLLDFLFYSRYFLVVFFVISAEQYKPQGSTQTSLRFNRIHDLNFLCIFQYKTRYFQGISGQKWRFKKPSLYYYFTYYSEKPMEFHKSQKYFIRLISDRN